MDIIHSTATHATQMVVAGDVAIKTGLGARKFQLSNDSRAGQQFEIAVYGAQADFWDPAADNFVGATAVGCDWSFWSYPRSPAADEYCVEEVRMA